MSDPGLAGFVGASAASGASSDASCRADATSPREMLSTRGASSMTSEEVEDSTPGSISSGVHCAACTGA